jgi:hypothetical protein
MLPSFKIGAIFTSADEEEPELAEGVRKVAHKENDTECRNDTNKKKKKNCEMHKKTNASTIED